ncbi:MAG: MBL fold metallo-hydrolase [Burkholderiales bacterium]|nr:MBL fold metallo-hydrolase [Burkholderiales bacterium]
MQQAARVVHPEVTAFFDPATWTFSYVVRDPASTACAIVDPVLDLDLPSGRIGTASARNLVEHVQRRHLQVEWIVETHVHADHLSAAAWVKAQVGGKVGIGARVTAVQQVFGDLFEEGPEFARDGRQFDHLFGDGESYMIGGACAQVMHTPGHTPACATHVVGDAAFVGDTLFMPDAGTARADFPGADARTLYRSIRRILELPPKTRLFMCHDYGPGGREVRWESTVARERAENIHVRDGIDEDAFVEMRTARDATLDVPRLLFPSLQVNMRAGHLPPAGAGGRRFLKLPLDAI